MLNRRQFYIALTAVFVLIAATYAYYRAIKPPLVIPVPDPHLDQQDRQSPEDLEASRFKAECNEAIARQRTYLDKDALAITATFEKYKVANLLHGQPADLNIESNKVAREFRTRIREELAKSGVNFAGHYSVVSVRMTGWGNNYFIVDRKNGNAYIFPYDAVQLDFKKDSNLLIMDSKEFILDALKTMDPIENACGYMPWRLVDLKPFYFLWQDDRLAFIGPRTMTPPLNQFWEGFENP